MRKYVLMTALFLMSLSAGAQKLGDIFNGVVNSVVGDKLTTAESIVGSWSFRGSDCCLDSDDFLSKAGGKIASAKLVDKLDEVISNARLKDMVLTLEKDGKFCIKAGKKLITGTYTFDGKKKIIDMHSSLGFSHKAFVRVKGDELFVNFKSDKIINVVKDLSSRFSSYDKRLMLLSKAASNYKGMKLGFRMGRNE